MKLDPQAIGEALVVVLAAAWFMLGCTSAQLRPCTGAENVALDCKAEQVKRGCP